MVYNQPPEHARKSKTKAIVIIQRTNKTTMTTEPTEHGASEWVNDFVLVLETDNTVGSTISKIQPITTSNLSATTKPKGHMDN